MIEIDIDFEEAPPAAPLVTLRGHQQDWVDTIERDIVTHSRILAVAPGGVGKSTLMAILALNAHRRGQKTLVLENRDRLTRQTADRIAKETGLQVEVEMGNEHASPFAPVVVACVQSLSRENRLIGFPDNHFHRIFPDEAHFSMSPGWQRILRYFHYGAQSLESEWQRPGDGTYEPKALICGFTATPDIGERRSLAEFYCPVERESVKRWSVDYSYLEAVQEGWLVGPVQKNIPVQIDLRKFRTASGPTGVDFRSQDLSAAMVPIIEKLADQVVEHASDRKTMAFLPSVECARMLAEACEARGMLACYVSGECLDIDDKTDRFVAAGPGSILANASIYNAGIDFPDVDCIAWFRATLSRAFYIQGIYRASRVVLPKGVLEACRSAAARRAAIAGSVKPNYLILDPLFVSDRIDLLDAYDLFTDRPEVKAKLKAAGEISPEAAQKAERDFIKSLEKEAKKHARKASRTIDPLAFAVSIGDDALKNYVPESGWESAPATPGQLQFIRQQGMATDGIKSKGLASKIIGRLMTRINLKLATPSQLDFMRKLGIDEQKAATLTMREAGELLDTTIAEKRARAISTA